MKNKLLKAINKISNKDLSYSTIERVSKDLYVATCDQNKMDKIIIDTRDANHYYVDLFQDGEKISTGIYLQGYNWWEGL